MISMGKIATNVDEQINLLEQRGMMLGESEKVKEHLLDIGYYRLGFYWLTQTPKSKPRLINYKSKFAKEKDKVVPAFTVAELGEVLLQIVESYKVYIFPKNLKFYHGRDEHGTCEASSEADLRAYMLIRAIECSKATYR